MKVFNQKVSNLKEDKKQLNKSMSQFQQNEQMKLPAMIKEPSANTIKFKFQITNELYEKYENAYAK